MQNCCVVVQADRATQELPSLVAPISRGLNAAVERLSLLEHTALKPGDAIQPNDLDKILARYVGLFPHVSIIISSVTAEVHLPWAVSSALICADAINSCDWCGIEDGNS